METLYILWIGGCVEYEGDCLKTAQILKTEWLSKGYDDVIIEEIKK